MNANRPRLLVLSKAIEVLTRPSDEEFHILRLEGVEDRTGFLRENGPGIDAILASGLERIDAARLDLMPDLKLISVVAAGMSGIDLDAARQRGVAVTNAGDLNAGAVAEYAVAMLLAHRREVVANDAYVRADGWVEKRRPPGSSVSAQKVGIVGLGNIGRGVAERLAPFGCEIAWWGPRAKETPWQRFENLDELAAWATTLVVAARGDDSTRGLITAAMIDALGPTGLIVNVSRGFVIDEPAMVAALKAGRLGGAALDVFENEPARAADWADVPNVLLAPHVGGATREAFAAVMTSAVDNVRRLAAGQPLRNRVV